MTYIKSKYFIKQSAFNWIVGIMTFLDIFFSKYIPKEARESIEVVLVFLYITLFILATFYFSFNTFTSRDLKYKIEDLEEEKEKSIRYSKKGLKYLSSFDKEEMISKYKVLLSKTSYKTPFIHSFKTKEEYTNNSNTLNYFLILLILFISQNSFDYLHTVGPLVFLAMILFSITFCIRVIIWEAIERKIILSQIILGHIFIIYLLFSWGKNSYIKTYGNEVIGSFFEKFEYKTQYYVNVFPFDKGGKSYRLAADIHVYSETVESEPIEDRYGQEYTNTYTSKYIILERAYWPNEGYLYFKDCQLKIGDKVLCSDQDDINWYIEITNEKVR